MSWQKISELDATSSTALTKAVLRTSEPGAWDSAADSVKLFRYKQLKLKTLLTGSGCFWLKT